MPAYICHLKYLDSSNVVCKLEVFGMQVNWEFWTNSNDMCGPVCDVQKEFIKVRHTPKPLF